MKIESILRTFLTAIFVLGTLAMNAQTKIYVYKTNGTTDEYNIAELDSISFTAPVAVDYSKLKLNEVSGVGSDNAKFYELINTGEVDIPLAGCKIYYNAPNNNIGGPFPTGKGNLTWEGSETQVADAGKLFCLIGRNAPGSFTTGLTAARVLIITLEDPDGNPIDQCIRAEDTGVYEIGDQSFSRIPDGTGAFYFTTSTPNATNGTSTEGLLLVPQSPVQVTVDYSNLVINEVNGVSGQKWVEIYNKGTESVPLKGVTIQYSNNNGSTFSTQYTFGATDEIAAKSFFSNSTQLGSLSANNVTIVVTINTPSPSNDVIDTYAKPLDINNGYSIIKNVAHARIPDGTGDWYYLVGDSAGSKNGSNGLSAEGFIQFGNEAEAAD